MESYEKKRKDRGKVTNKLEAIATRKDNNLLK